MKDQLKQIEDSISLVSNLVSTVIKSDRKENVSKMLSGSFGELFFTCPASSKKEYHSSYPGGLVVHSLNVYRNLRKLNQTFNCQFSEESMLIVSLFHDIGKASACDLTNPHYLPSEQEWQLNKGWMYQYNENDVYMPNHVRSMFILSQFNIKLTPEEYQAIYLNDGMYISENKSFALKECLLALYTHIADRLAVAQEKAEQV